MPPHRTPSVARRVAWAVLLSLGLHGLIVTAVWLAPVKVAATPPAVADPTQVAEDYAPLGLDAAPPPVYKPPAPPKRDPPPKPASFDVKIVDSPATTTVGEGPPAPPVVLASATGRRRRAGRHGRRAWRQR